MKEKSLLSIVKIVSLTILVTVISSCSHHGHKGCGCKMESGEGCKGKDSKQCDMKAGKEGAHCGSEAKEAEKESETKEP